ncbi:MAG: POTRA domain-containing protein [Cyanobacteria bacterium P01_G01_bin.54]
MTRLRSLFIFSILLSVLYPTAQAQSAPNTDVNSVAARPRDVAITVHRIEVYRSTQFTTADFAPILEPLLGNTTLAELHAAVDQITQLYVAQNYFTSRAILLPQTLENGAVAIEVIEGNLNDQTAHSFEQLQNLEKPHKSLHEPPTLATEPLVFEVRPTDAAALQNPIQLAQVDPNPNQDRFLQAPEDPLPEPLPPEELILTPEVTPAEPEIPEDAAIIFIEDVEIVGSTIFTAEELASITDWLQGYTTLGTVKTAVDKITRLYTDRGYLTSRAIIPTQTLGQGPVKLTLEIVEGSLTHIEVVGLERMEESYITSRINQGIDEPLNVNDLEEQLRLLQIDPNFEAVDVKLESGEALGTSILRVAVEEADPFFGSVTIDNYSPRSVGSTRSVASLNYRNLEHPGDVLSFDYTQTFAGGLDIWDLGYSIPLNPMNGTLDVGVALTYSSIITSPFDILEIDSESQVYEVSFRQPLKRTATEEFALSAGFTHRDGQTFVFDNIGQPFSDGADADGVTRTSVFSFGQDYTLRDRNGAWSARSQFNIGTELINATQSDNSPTADGQFVSWLGQIARVQRINDQHTLIIQGDLQLSGNSLLSSESFTIGGAQTLRGYRQGARNGDNGLRFSIEDRITLLQDPARGELLQVAPFFDYGMVWNNADNPSQITAEHLLAGIGAAILYQPFTNLLFRLDLAIPLTDLSDRQDDLQDDGIYFRMNYGF